MEIEQRTIDAFCTERFDYKNTKMEDETDEDFTIRKINEWIENVTARYEEDTAVELAKIKTAKTIKNAPKTEIGK